MGRKTSARASSVVLIIHGTIEVVGPIIFVCSPRLQGLIAGEGFWGQGLEADALFTAAIALIWGLLRLAAALGTWSMKKRAIILGVLLSVTTMTAASTAIPFGIVDTILSAPALILLLDAWFGDETR